MCAPLIGPVSIADYLKFGQIEQVLCDGENYGGARICQYEWVKHLSEECSLLDITFVFCGTGRRFMKDGKLYKIEKQGIQSEQAYRSGLSHVGKPMTFKLYDEWGSEINETADKRFFLGKCQSCGMKLICNGCSKCGKCG